MRDHPDSDPDSDAGQHPGKVLGADELLSLVDHEIRNLATVLSAVTSRLDDRWPQLGDHERRDLAHRIAAQVAELSTLLDNLHTLRTAGAFAATPDSDRIDNDPARTLRRIIADLRAAAADHPLDADIAADLPAMPLDVGRINQVLRNLVANSSKFSPPGSTISIRVRLHGDEVRVTVDDTGPGIPRDQREVVFDKFVQLEPRRPGSGLGLFVARSIVRALGGRIWIADGPGGGCRVVIALPAKPGAPSEAGPGNSTGVT